MFILHFSFKKNRRPNLQVSTKSGFDCSLGASFQSFIWEQVKSEAKDGHALDHANKGSLFTVGVVSYTSTV